MGQLGGINKANRASEIQKTEKAAGNTGSSFSSALKSVGEAQAENKVAASERAARIEELKTQIGSGNYEPDLNQVASSLLKFLVESNKG